MNVIIDVIGAFVIGSMLMLLLVTFQFQLKDTADTAIYMASMIEHMQSASTRLNGIIALAGIGYSPSNTVNIADSTRFGFLTKWNYKEKVINTTSHTIELKLSNVQTELGKSIIIMQDGQVLNDLGYIFWVEELKFRYFDRDDQITTERTRMRSVEVRLKFSHDIPGMQDEQIFTKLQMRCFMMNSYLAGA